jgi:hypothetical protein
MRRQILIEGILLIVIGIIVLADGLRLATEARDPLKFYEVMGPDIFNIFLSVVLMILGVVHLAAHYRKSLVKRMAEVVENEPMRKQVMGMIAVLTIYPLLIYIVGYLMASIIFFILEFRIVGVNSWRTNIILTFTLTAGYYIIFVQLCDMIFPSGMLF